MRTQSIKEVFARFGTDQPKTPSMTRAQRLAKVAPPIVAEALERRRMLDGSAVITGDSLVVTGSSVANDISIYYVDTDLIGVDISGNVSDQFGPFDVDNFDVAQVSAGAGNDSVVLYNSFTGGSVPFPSIVYGEDGHDTIHATDQADLIYGGAGNDSIRGVFGNDSVYGGDGNDLIYSDFDNDIIYGGVGYDTVYGGDDNDTVFGGSGSGDSDDSVTGYDLLYGEGGNDVIRGEGGGDTIYGGDGADTLYGGDFSDFIVGGSGADIMYGDDGDDTLDAREGTPATDILYGGNGNDCGYWDGGDSTIDMEGQL